MLRCRCLTERPKCHAPMLSTADKNSAALLGTGGNSRICPRPEGSTSVIAPVDKAPWPARTPSDRSAPAGHQAIGTPGAATRATGEANRESQLRKLACAEIASAPSDRADDMSATAPRGPQQTATKANNGTHQARNTNPSSILREDDAALSPPLQYNGRREHVKHHRPAAASRGLPPDLGGQAALAVGATVGNRQA
nr:hypothetical protein fc10 [uncultured bacterium]